MALAEPPAPPPASSQVAVAGPPRRRRSADHRCCDGGAGGGPLTDSLPPLDAFARRPPTSPCAPFAPVSALPPPLHRARRSLASPWPRLPAGRAADAHARGSSAPDKRRRLPSPVDVAAVAAAAGAVPAEPLLPAAVLGFTAVAGGGERPAGKGPRAAAAEAASAAAVRGPVGRPAVAGSGGAAASAAAAEASTKALRARFVRALLLSTLRLEEA
ncbi:hypothetical protein BU14_0502s0010 [Porphyra umbilicalis]|uniref:Uncharacterized protein n=1 Tax=Porphyra umbilicalis TaxID=2786 RepID=A0A1X6NTE8_PORUM|nr:hypothetical protein BU14_0502s0010 [Porphyra umbilicalis]|eukprot:OSX71776.1 hypothetical protein BU14_0502s0010 [Porphyra umbilicalis]